ncbi:MAG TPA: hypothetical protein VGR74_12085 [Actinomycetota bacterium]|jgi:hypothetical protein|nr:hypothetical protein [Actinomycetota bacterium]
MTEDEIGDKAEGFAAAYNAATEAAVDLHLRGPTTAREARRIILAGLMSELTRVALAFDPDLTGEDLSALLKRLGAVGTCREVLEAGKKR